MQYLDKWLTLFTKSIMLPKEYKGWANGVWLNSIHNVGTIFMCLGPSSGRLHMDSQWTTNLYFIYYHSLSFILSTFSFIIISTLFENLMAVYIGSSQTWKYNVFVIEKKTICSIDHFLMNDYWPFLLSKISFH